MKKWPKGKYHIILADPPWPERGQAETNKGFRRNFRVMTEEDLLRLPVKDLADPDCFLLLWSTWRHVPFALRVMEAWGFAYRTGFPWIKGSFERGTLHHTWGRYILGVSEPILVGSRSGKAPQLKGKGIPVGLVADIAGVLEPRAHYARKPESVKDIAEGIVPGGPWIELFARPPHRRGWDVWGDEA